MDFTVELKEFPTMLHRSIYCAARELTPTARSLAGMTDEALRASCLEYNGFITNMLGDMYEYPEAYHMPAGVDNYYW